MTPPQFRILGPLEAAAGAHALRLGGTRPRRLLAMLLLHRGQPVSVDRLVDAVWDDNPPASAGATLRTHVSALRHALAGAGVGELLVTSPPGYALAVDAEQVDAGRFERLAGEGRAAFDGGEPARAATLLREALRLWRGGVLEDLDAPRFAEAEAACLEELRVAALETRIDADLTLGGHRELVGELEALVDAHPFREHLCGQLMLALYRSGRQAAALEAYRTVRHRLDEELGLAPGEALADLETAILRHDPALALPTGRSAAAAGESGGAARVEPPTAVPSRPQPSPDALFDVVRRVPMVGRDAELGRLRTLWEVARDGGRRVALVAGEAGVGKTRLVAELAHLAASEGATLLVGHCEQAAEMPYRPVANALGASPEAAAAITDLSEPHAARLSQLIGQPPHAERVQWASADDPRTLRQAFLDATTELLARLADATPVVFVVEEAEELDQASARLLRHLTRNLPGGVLLLGCFREPQGSRHPALLELLADVEGRGLGDRVDLAPLPECELAGLVATWTGTDASARVVRRLWAYTGGNPFFASEVIRDLTARGELAFLEADWSVPTSVRDVLRQRLHALPQTARQVVACAAVLGREVDFELLVRLADLGEDRLVAALEEAVRSGWLVESGHCWEATYTFRHALMREAVYVDVSAPRRQRLHLRAAEALEEHGPRQAAEMIATAGHLRAAGSLADPARTARAYRRAADAAAGLYAWDEAIAHAETAMAVLDAAEAPPAQQGEAATHTARLLANSTLDYARAAEHLRAALRHYRAAGDEAAAAKVHSRLGTLLCTHHRVMDIPAALEHFAAAEPVRTGDTAALHLQAGTAQAALHGLRTAQGSTAAARAVELADTLERPDLMVWASWGRAWHRFNLGELAAARTSLEEAWAIAQELDRPYPGWAPVYAAATQYNVYLQDPAASEAWCQQGLSQPRLNTIAHPRDGILDHLVYALATMGRREAAHEAVAGLPADAVSRRLLLQQQGEWESAERSWAEALDHDLAAGDLLDAVLNLYWLGQVRWLLGREANATASLRRALAISLDGPQVPAELMVRAELARLLALGGAAVEAAEHVRRCDRILAGGEDWRGQAGNVELARAAVADATQRREQAERAYHRAVEIYVSYRLPWRQAEALRMWADELSRAGRTGQAKEKRRAAGQVYDQLGVAGRWRGTSPVG